MTAASAAVAHTSTVEDGAYDNAKATHGHDADQHGGTEGHIDVENYGFELVSKLKMSKVVEGKIADVGIHKSTAYLAAWGGSTCKANGVHVVDIAEVTAPKEIAFIPSKEGSYPGEGVQALSISTPAFNGDILVTNNEKCKQPAGFGGMNIYDVSNPAAPEVLAQGFGDDQANNKKQSAHQTHSVFAWQDGQEAYAVMVDNEEAADVDIVDITNPRKPVLVAEYDLAKDLPQIVQKGQGLDEVFLHDMVVKEINGDQVMLLSYWDAGYVQLNVNDPRDPRLLADSTFAYPADSQAAENQLFLPDGKTFVPPEGNAHQAEFTKDNRFVIAADEDFSPFATLAKNLTDKTDLTVSQGSGTPALKPTQEITGSTVFFGRGCIGDPSPPTPGNPNAVDIAVVERGLCTFTEKVASVEKAGGFDAVLVFNRTGSDGCDAGLGMSVEGGLPTFGVAPRGQGFALFNSAYDNEACLAGAGPERLPVNLGTAGEQVTFASYFDGWGYVRLLDGTTMEEKDTYAIPEAHDIEFAEGSGDLSVHEVATSGLRADLAFLSYYAGGVRAITVDEVNGIQEVGAFIDKGGNNFWGVEVFSSKGKEYVALSDRDFGLYIFKYTG